MYNIYNVLETCAVYRVIRLTIIHPMGEDCGLWEKKKRNGLLVRCKWRGIFFFQNFTMIIWTIELGSLMGLLFVSSIHKILYITNVNKINFLDYLLYI